MAVELNFLPALMDKNPPIIMEHLNMLLTLQHFQILLAIIIFPVKDWTLK